MGLTDKQQAFVEHYLSCWNATQAALLAGYSERTAYSIGHENLKKPEIDDEIKRRLSDVSMTADEVLVRMAEQARGVGQYLIDVTAGLPFMNWERLAKENKLHLIKKLSYDREGRPQVEFYDAQAALFQLAKHHGLLIDKQEMTGKDGGAIPIRIEYVDRPPDLPPLTSTGGDV